MVTTPQMIREEVRKLPFTQRLKLVAELEIDLDADESAAPGEVDAAWDSEEGRRAEEIAAGNVRLLTHDDLMRRLDDVRAKHTA